MPKIKVGRAVVVKGKALGLDAPYRVLLGPGEHEVDDVVADYLKENTATGTVEGGRKSKSKAKSKSFEEPSEEE